MRRDPPKLDVFRLAVDLGLLAADDAQVGRECSDHVVRALQKLQQAVGRFEGVSFVAGHQPPVASREPSATAARREPQAGVLQ